MILGWNMDLTWISSSSLLEPGSELDLFNVWEQLELCKNAVL